MKQELVKINLDCPLGLRNELKLEAKKQGMFFHAYIVSLLEKRNNQE